MNARSKSLFKDKNNYHLTIVFGGKQLQLGSNCMLLVTRKPGLSVLFCNFLIIIRIHEYLFYDNALLFVLV